IQPLAERRFWLSALHISQDFLNLPLISVRHDRHPPLYRKSRNDRYMKRLCYVRYHYTLLRGSAQACLAIPIIVIWRSQRFKARIMPPYNQSSEWILLNCPADTARSHSRQMLWMLRLSTAGGASDSAGREPLALLPPAERLR